MGIDQPQVVTFPSVIIEAGVLSLVRAQYVSNTDHHLKITHYVNFFLWLARSEKNKPML